MQNQFSQIIDCYEQLKLNPSRMILATIVETMGSTYQKAGAKMLIDSNGEFKGLLGGGCFEADLLEKSQSVLKSGKAELVFYDMRSADDAVWGLGLGCNGAVRVLLQRLNHEEDFIPLNIIVDSWRCQTTSVMGTVCESEHPAYKPGQSLLFDSNDSNTIHSSHINRVLRQQQSEFISHDIEGNHVCIFYDLLKPPRRLLIIGAGPDAVPVTQFAKALGWHVTLVDHRASYASRDRFTSVDDLMITSPQTIAGDLKLSDFNALVLMTHNIEKDEQYLNVIADHEIAYIGLLGPAKRRDRLLASIGNKAKNLDGHVFGPTGLDIGARTPEEIALSILAEIHTVLAGQTGNQLIAISDTETSARQLGVQ